MFQSNLQACRPAESRTATKQNKQTNKQKNLKKRFCFHELLCYNDCKSKAGELLSQLAWVVNKVVMS